MTSRPEPTKAEWPARGGPAVACSRANASAVFAARRTDRQKAWGGMDDAK